jgi:hypothetical protein
VGNIFSTYRLWLSWYFAFNMTDKSKFSGWITCVSRRSSEWTVRMLMKINSSFRQVSYYSIES